MCSFRIIGYEERKKKRTGVFTRLLMQAFDKYPLINSVREDWRGNFSSDVTEIAQPT